jgi:charged multivesicular body protein 3
MMKAGILEEMIEDTMEGLEGEGEEEEEAAQAEIDRIMFELTAGALGTAPDALKGELF